MISLFSNCDNRDSVITAGNFNQFNTKNGTKTILLLIVLLVHTAPFHAFASSPDDFRSDISSDNASVALTAPVVTEPNVTVRFANPQYDCGTMEYCVDVEFQCDQPDRELFAMNVRFFYDDNLLEYIDFRDFQGTYGPISPDPPLNVYTTAGVPWFNFSTGADNIRGAIQRLGNNDPVYMSTDGWTKLFQICFSVDDPPDEDNFCPSLVWDLEADPANGGFIPGSEGVVMSVYNPDGNENSFEHVEQFNWQYIGDGGPPFGEPIEAECISVNCGTCSLVVNTTDDSGPGSLREKIECASSGDTITFASSMEGQTIIINSTRLIVSKSLYIRSNLSNRVKIKSTIAGLFELSPGKTLEIKDIDIISGLTMSSNGGAAFRNSGTLRFFNVNVEKNISLPSGQYLIRNLPGSQLLLHGDCFIESP